MTGMGKHANRARARFPKGCARLRAAPPESGTMQSRLFAKQQGCSESYKQPLPAYVDSINYISFSRHSTTINRSALAATNVTSDAPRAVVVGCSWFRCRRLALFFVRTNPKMFPATEMAATFLNSAQRLQYPYHSLEFVVEIGDPFDCSTIDTATGGGFHQGAGSPIESALAKSCQMNKGFIAEPGWRFDWVARL